MRPIHGGGDFHPYEPKAGTDNSLRPPADGLNGKEYEKSVLY